MDRPSDALIHRVHTEWRLPISGVHPIMMEKSALAGEGGGVRRPPPFSLLPSRTKVHSLCFISALCVLCALIIDSISRWQRSPNYSNGKKTDCPELGARAGTTWTGDSKCREVKTGFGRKRPMQTGSSETLIGWKSGKTTCVPLRDRI